MMTSGCGLNDLNFVLPLMSEMLQNSCYAFQHSSEVDYRQFMSLSATLIRILTAKLKAILE